MDFVDGVPGQRFGLWGHTNVSMFCEPTTPQSFRLNNSKDLPESCAHAGKHNVLAYFRDNAEREIVKVSSGFGQVTTNIRHIDPKSFYEKYDIAGPVVAQESGYNISKPITVTMSGPATLVNTGDSIIHSGEDVYALHPSFDEVAPWNFFDIGNEVAESRAKKREVAPGIAPAVLVGGGSRIMRHWRRHIRGLSDARLKRKEMNKIAHVFVGRAITKGLKKGYLMVTLKH